MRLRVQSGCWFAWMRGQIKPAPIPVKANSQITSDSLHRRESTGVVVLPRLKAQEVFSSDRLDREGTKVAARRRIVWELHPLDRLDRGGTKVAVRRRIMWELHRLHGQHHRDHRKTGVRNRPPALGLSRRLPAAALPGSSGWLFFSLFLSPCEAWIGPPQNTKHGLFFNCE